MQSNKNNFKFFISFLVLMTTGLVFGHNPSNSTTLLIEGKDGNWMLQIRASLTAFEKEVHKRYTKDSYKTPEEFKNLVAKLIANDVSLALNNTPIVLENAQIKLGHETVVVFQFKKMDTFEEIQYKNIAFKSIFNSKNTFFVVKKGLDKDKFILNKNNDYKVDLKLVGTTLTATNTATQKSSSFNFFIILILLGIPSLLILIYKKNKTAIT